MDSRIILYFIAGGGFFLFAFYTADYLYERIYNHWVKFQIQRLSFRERALAIKKQEQALALNEVQMLAPDENGRSGVMYAGRAYPGHDAILAEFEARYFQPIMALIDNIEEGLLALVTADPPAARQALGSWSPAAIPPAWPKRVELAGLFGERRPSLRRLAVGARPGTTPGDLDVVWLGLHDLMPALVVGASGWGASAWLRALLWQVAQAPEPVQVVAVDAAGGQLDALNGWSKLRRPVARTPQAAKDTLAEVAAEIKRRQRLSAGGPLAKVPPWLVVVAGGTTRLGRSRVGEPLWEALETGWRVGVYLLVTGQSAQRSAIDAGTRGHFRCRLCFRASPASSRAVLGSGVAGELTRKGRMWAQLPSWGLVALQGPFVDREAFLAVLEGGLGKKTTGA